MEKLSRDSLYSLEKYAEVRPEFRQQVMEHKKSRRVPIGEHATLYFEDKLTMQYQVQEMLRAERIFEAEGINEELDAYNPLIPDGSNLKATFMIEYQDVEERKQALSQLIGVERQVWLRVGDLDKVYPIANEDLERETEEKTSSVHFLRFEFTPEMIVAAQSGATMRAGIDHDYYTQDVQLAQDVRDSLTRDFSIN
jgi:hypothetical protein